MAEAPTYLDTDLEKEIDLSDVDFSDLEEKYNVSIDLNNYVVVDGAPVAPESKVPVLSKVLRKLFGSVGTIVDGDEGMYMPVEDGKTKGYLFIQFSTPEEADAAIAKMHGKKLDQNHRLLVNKLTDIEKYTNVATDFVEPEVKPFESHGYLKSYLQDPTGRDQMMLHFSETVGLYWYKKSMDPEPVVEPRKAFTSKYAKFSPKGTWLFSIHPQGVQAWGGQDLHKINKFFHNQVRLIDFSPTEKYMVTLSPVPITLPDSVEARAEFPFGKESIDHKLVIWDLASGEPVRTFALPPHLEGQKEMPWPLVKWSYDDKYCARMGPDALAVYDTENFQLLDKRLVKINNLVDFEFAPAGVQLANKKQGELSHLLSYWTPELPNQTARVAVMELPSRDVLRTVNLHQVSDAKMHWQSEGKALGVKVDRHTKSGKTLFTNLEFFRTTERDIPVEKLELKEVVINFAFEPNSERFVVISRLDDGNNNPAIPKNTITFYEPEEKLGKTVYKVLKQVKNKHSNTVVWSPKGRYVVIATILRNNGELDFYDTRYEADDEPVKQLRVEKYTSMTNLSWDPSGRFIAAWSSQWMHNIDNGYHVYDFTGQQVRDETVEQFKEFIWRPRPASLLTDADREKVRANLQEYAAQFEEADAMEADAAVREAILARRKALEKWRAYRAKHAHKEKQHKEVQVETIEEIKEQVIEEKEEVIE
ncbi:eukaryotic translation initiation factor 3 subunit B [Diutina catenulata]